MAQATDILHTAISHWQLDAATGAKDAKALRATMHALAAHIDTSEPGRIGSQERSRLQSRLESMAHAVKPQSEVDQSADSSQTGHVSVFA